MPYRSRVDPLVTRQIRSWGLSDFVWTEVLLRLHQTLPADPHGLLVRVGTPWEGMAYLFDLIDPENRLCVHTFAFEVLYGMDEETLYIVRGVHVRSYGV